MPKISQIDQVPCQAEVRIFRKTKFATTALSISWIVLESPLSSTLPAIFDCTFGEASHRRLRSSVVTARGIQKQKTASHRKTYCSIFWRISYFVSWFLTFWLVEFWSLNTPPVSYFCKLFESCWSYNVSMNYTLSCTFSASTLKCIPDLISLQLLTSPVMQWVLV